MADYTVVKLEAGEPMSWTPACGTTPVQLTLNTDINPFGYDATSMMFFKIRGIDPKWFDFRRMSLWPACKMAELR